jgi:hypothetical protein
VLERQPNRSHRGAGQALGPPAVEDSCSNSRTRSSSRSRSTTTGRRHSSLEMRPRSSSRRCTPSRPHLAFFQAPPHQRLYLDPTMDCDQYVWLWQGPGWERIHGYRQQELTDDLWPWLKEQGLATPEDDEVFHEFRRLLRSSPVALRQPPLMQATPPHPPSSTGDGGRHDVSEDPFSRSAMSTRSSLAPEDRPPLQSASPTVASARSTCPASSPTRPCIVSTTVPLRGDAPSTRRASPLGRLSRTSTARLVTETNNSRGANETW